MHFTTSIAFLIILQGVLSAPLDNNLDVHSDNKIQINNEQAPPVSDDSSLIKDKKLISDDKNEKADSVNKDEKAIKALSDSSNLEKNNKSIEDKSPSSRSENNIESVLKDKKDEAVVEVSPDKVDVQLDQEIEKKKSKEVLKKIVDDALAPQDGKLKDESLLYDKEQVSRTIKNLINVMIQAPLNVVKAFKAILEGLVFGVRPDSTTTTTVTSAAP